MPQKESTPKLTTNNRLLLAFISLHIGLITLVCIGGSIRAYIFIHGELSSQAAIKSKSIITKTIAAPLIRQYLAVAGIDAPYGYFAPNVASGYVLKFTVEDGKRSLPQALLPNLKTKEGLIRYNTLLGSFQEKFKALNEQQRSGGIKQEVNPVYIKYLDVIIKSLSKHHLAYEGIKAKAKTITTTLYVYHYPSLRSYRLGATEPTLILVSNVKASYK